MQINKEITKESKTAVQTATDKINLANVSTHLWSDNLENDSRKMVSRK